MSEFGAEKVYFRDKQGKWVAHAQKTRTPQWFGGEVFISKLWAETSRTYDFLLIDWWWVTGWCSRNLALSLKSLSSIWMRDLLPSEELKNAILYIP